MLQDLFWTSKVFIQIYSSIYCLWYSNFHSNKCFVINLKKQNKLALWKILLYVYDSWCVVRLLQDYIEILNISCKYYVQPYFVTLEPICDIWYKLLCTQGYTFIEYRWQWWLTPHHRVQKRHLQCHLLLYVVVLDFISLCFD